MIRARHAERLTLAVLAVCSTLLFELWPELDLAISRWFHAGMGRFPADESDWVRVVYGAVPWMGRALFLASLSALVLAGLGRWRLSRRWVRRAAACALCMLMGVGIVVHGVLKDHWGRARPVEVAEFGGAQGFTPALQQARSCRTNCSFVSGHAATGFALMAPGMFATARTRRRWLAVGVGAGSVIGVLRVAQGRHFASDIVFSLVVVWCTCLVCREAWLRIAVRRRQGIELRPAAVT